MENTHHINKIIYAALGLIVVLIIIFALISMSGKDVGEDPTAKKEGQEIEELIRSSSGSRSSSIVDPAVQELIKKSSGSVEVSDDSSRKKLMEASTGN